MFICGEFLIGVKTEMNTETATRPNQSEYLPYYEKYVSMVPDGPIITTLSNQIAETLELLARIPESQAGFRYDADKWSIKGLVGHVIDSERVFAYRALRFARNDKTALPGYEQDDYVRSAQYDSWPLEEIASELKSVRESTIYLFKHLNADAWTRTGVANDAQISVRALAYIIAGHELHHREVLRTRYLQANAGGAGA